MTPSEAKLFHNLAIQAEKDAWETAYGKSLVSFPASTEQVLKHGEASRSRREFERELMSYPELWPSMRCLMVDIVSSDNTCEYIAIDLEDDSCPYEIDHQEAFNHLMGQELPNKILDWAESRGFSVSDTGLGAKWWHIGIHCTIPEAQVFCMSVREEFVEAFESGAVRMNLKPWSIAWKE